MIQTIKGFWDDRFVFVDGKKLNPLRSQKIWNHSPDGFNWGYGGSGPAQLALALLLEYATAEIAVRYHQDFKREVIALLPQRDFEMRYDIQEWLDLKLEKLKRDDPIKQYNGGKNMTIKSDQGIVRIIEVMTVVVLCLFLASLFLKICGDEMKYQIYMEWQK